MFTEPGMVSAAVEQVLSPIRQLLVNPKVKEDISATIAILGDILI